MNEAARELRFRYGNHVAIVYRSGQLKLVDCTSGRTHVINEECAKALLRFCEPCILERVLDSYPTVSNETILEFLRLTRAGFIIEADSEPEACSRAIATPFWEDAYVYHMLSRTMKSSRFMDSAQQHTRFLTMLADKPRSENQCPCEEGEIVLLPDVEREDIGLLSVLHARRTRRVFCPKPVPLADLAWLFDVTWRNKMCCLNRPLGLNTYLRTSPSGGGLQSIDSYVFVLNVEGMDRGAYWYDPDGHNFCSVSRDVADEWLIEACGDQRWVRHAGFICIAVASFDLAAAKYNASRGYRILLIEAGHFNQTFLLAAESAGKAAATFGAINEELVEEKLGIAPGERAILLATAVGELDVGSTYSDWITGRE